MQKNSQNPLFHKKSNKPVEGIVIETLPGLSFRVKIAEEQEILAYLAGKMKLNYIRVLPGDRVSVELSPDGKRGRIVRRL